MSEKKTQKRSKKGTRGARVKPTVGLWVPLKLRKGTSEDQKTRQVDQTRPDEPEGTVADLLWFKHIGLLENKRKI